ALSETPSDRVNQSAAASCGGPVTNARAVEAKHAVTDSLGRRWATDCRASGGKLVHAKGRVNQTASHLLYANARIGIKRLRIHVHRDGNYLVVLYLAEIGSARPGQRVFDVW